MEERYHFLTEIQRLGSEVQHWQEIANAGRLRSLQELDADLQQWFGPTIWNRLAPYHEGLLMAHREAEVADKTHEEGTYRDAVFNVWKVFEQVLRKSWMASVARWVAQDSLAQRRLWQAHRREVVVTLESTSHSEAPKQIRWSTQNGNFCTLGDMESLLFDRVIAHYVRPEYWTTVLTQWAEMSHFLWITEPAFYHMLEQTRTHRNPHAHAFPITAWENWPTLWNELMNPATGWIVRLVNAKWL